MVNVVIKTVDEGYELVGLNKYMDRNLRLYLTRKFKAQFRDGSIYIPDTDSEINISVLVEALQSKSISLELDNAANDILKNKFIEEEKFKEFSQAAKNIWNNEFDKRDFEHFCEVVSNKVQRKLYPLQLLSAYHLAFSQNACNFSVPGAGKTSIVYGAFSYLKSRDDFKHVEKILVVGPLSSFGPWENEYLECFGVEPKVQRISGGGLTSDEKRKYFYSEFSADITLISYQGFINQSKNIEFFLKNNKVMVILDEAHKIKNTDGGRIAEVILEVAEFAKSRVVLTGTPSPNGYRDLYNLFKFIWPNKDIISFSLNQLDEMTNSSNDARIPILINDISAFFVRIKKSDLNLPPKIENEPILVEMDPVHQKIYKLVSNRTIGSFDGNDIDSEGFTNDLKKAKIIRMIQASSNPYLLLKPLNEFYGEDGDITKDDELTSLLKFYKNKRMIPNKFEEALKITRSIISQKGKVIVWAVFIDTIEFLSEYFTENGIENKVLYGKTKIESDNLSDETETRESIIRDFHKVDSNFKVIIANPFAVAESISLHKACHNAIYLERNFDAARYLQSKDRIHRYGLDPKILTNYYYLTSKGSIDEVIQERLAIKEQLILRVSESNEIPLFSNLDDDLSNEDIKAVLKYYSDRVN